MTRSKDPEGACPRCRKLIPLVPADGGSLVLEGHRVVAMERKYGMADLAVCPGSGSGAASLDDSEDWAWVTPDPQWVRDDTPRAPVRLTDSADAVPVADDQCSARTGLWGLCRCVKLPCDGAHRCTCGHSWAAREYAG